MSAWSRAEERNADEATSCITRFPALVAHPTFSSVCLGSTASKGRRKNQRTMMYLTCANTDRCDGLLVWRPIRISSVDSFYFGDQRTRTADFFACEIEIGTGKGSRTAEVPGYRRILSSTLGSEPLGKFSTLLYFSTGYQKRRLHRFNPIRPVFEHGTTTVLLQSPSGNFCL